ncbi:hypothetical protein AMTR_s00001p00271150 [Amborella trichopoda]|uniref:Uncharacterized protein n=1 Tax=Amborella trichopoda TaxID=13333 RepID=W1NM46_AMBTC|nr:hypothetical protein AMTR_s00001p00271150 [Amborella trichopoda]
MLDIKNTSKEDKLFNFMVGLQPWAQVELRKQGVKELPLAIALLKSLVDFKLNAATNGARLGKNKAKGKKACTNPKPHASGLPSEESSGKIVSKDFSGSSICKRPHRAEYCPHKQSLDTVQSVAEEEVEVTSANPLQMHSNALQLYAMQRW